MPLIRVETNAELPAATADVLLAELSRAAAQVLGKSETYVMVSAQSGSPMLFGGSPEPAAFLDVRSIGLSEDQARPLSHALCDLVNRHVGVATERVYINFTDMPRRMWGWNGATF